MIENAGTTCSRDIDEVYGKDTSDPQTFFQLAAARTSLAGMSEILDAVRAGATGEALAEIPMPAATRAVFVRRDEQNMFDGMASKDKDPRRSLHVD